MGPLVIRESELEKTQAALERHLYRMISKQLSLKLVSSGMVIATWEGMPVLAIQLSTPLTMCDMGKGFFELPGVEKEKIVEEEGVDIKEFVRRELPGLWGYIYQ